MKVFGDCKDFSRDRLVSEFNLVKKEDPNHPVLISRSNNWVGIPVGAPTPDRFQYPFISAFGTLQSLTATLNTRNQPGLMPLSPEQRKF
jgi:hypothetical protein